MFLNIFPLYTAKQENRLTFDTWHIATKVRRIFAIQYIHNLAGQR
jgi:hypothetical protein